LFKENSLIFSLRSNKSDSSPSTREGGFLRQKIYKYSDNSWKDRSLLKEGRAKEFGCRDNHIQYFDIDVNNYNGDEIVSIVDPSLNLTCSGWIIADCNWSYHSMDNNKKIQIAHIDDIDSTEQLVEAIMKFNNNESSYITT